MPIRLSIIRIGLPAVAIAFVPSGESVAQTGPTAEAPSRRVLTGADDERVGALEARIDELEREGQFVEALTPAKEASAIRARAQGVDDWQAADARRRVERLERFAALPAEARADLASVIK